MKKLITIFILTILLFCGVVGCSTGFSVGPPESPYGNAHIEIIKANQQ